MAKSLRSKWRRKMKAEKRVRYGKKETDRLIKMLTEAGDYQMLPEVKEEPVDPPESPIDDTDIMDSVIVADIPAPTITVQKRSKSKHDRRRLSRRSRRDEVESDSDDEGVEKDIVVEKMDTAKEKVERIFNKRSKRDQFGNYPSWMSARKVTKQKKRNKRLVAKANRLKTKKKV